MLLWSYFLNLFNPTGCMSSARTCLRECHRRRRRSPMSLPLRQLCSSYFIHCTSQVTPPPSSSSRYKYSAVRHDQWFLIILIDMDLWPMPGNGSSNGSSEGRRPIDIGLQPLADYAISNDYTDGNRLTDVAVGCWRARNARIRGQAICDLKWLHR